MRELTVRALSGLLYVIILLFSILYSEKWYILLFLLFGIITLREFLRLIGFQFWYTYAILISFILFFSYFKVSKIATLILLGFTVVTGLYLMKNLFSEKIRKYGKLQKLHITVFYIIASFVFLTLLPSHGDEFSPYTVAGLFILIWTNDTFAYIVGKSFGRHKLFPSISPKKTIEGFFGGLVFACIASYFIHKFTGSLNFNIWLSLAVVMSTLGTFGDLIESKLKREAGVKDSGTLMPGHGGLYDRLDSILFASPFIYLVLIVFEYVS
ncbi:phosphatidate cytidylyltransferase [Leeuwenhoekiella aequorea]|uniref:Phosphatidate cytidylyltransferase n=1 Tax=Leeuwenhoekiella aequorea TaxID=283736 RepID=A0A4Q0PDB0_9FLAO|nr:phosphatidate cytidylyltransferase [Leeuwenhoekiella aequorea]RXG24807.1 phosphatidate cytidylyltransferase [Leeuwenhoekiella aequorea]|tara:strand:+ start:714 stop:1517 length:804 start_codon:yes stop_codon:yes gene_type:complete